MNKKQFILILLFSFFISFVFCGSVYSDMKVTPVKTSDQVSVIDKILCKKIILPGGDNRPVLVNRITGEVKYIFVHNKKWILLTGEWKKQCQARYDALTTSKK